MPDSTVSSRRNLPGMFVAAPAVILAAGLVLFEGLAWVGPSTPRASDVSEASFVEALRQGDMEQAFAFIRAGHDPNVPVTFRDQVLTGGRDIRIAPLLIAVAFNRDDSVAMLMGYGARLDAPGNRFAACLATRMEHEEIAAAITRDSGPAVSRPTCPDFPPPSDAPLLAYVE